MLIIEIDLYINPSMYTITDDGNIFSKKRTYTDSLGKQYNVEKFKMNLTEKPNGYLTVRLKNKDGKRKTYYVHRLVYTSFSGMSTYTGEFDVHHIDYNKSNCRYTNLKKLSHRDNVADYYLKQFGTDIEKDNSNKCIDCRCVISNLAIRCEKCMGKHARSYRISSKSISEVLISNNGNFKKSASIFGMSDNALRKWCKKYNLPTKSKEWKCLSKH